MNFSSKKIRNTYLIHEGLSDSSSYTHHSDNFCRTLKPNQTISKSGSFSTLGAPAAEDYSDHAFMARPAIADRKWSQGVSIPSQLVMQH